MKQITKNVYYENTLRGCNTGFVVTDEGVVVIDTPMVPMEARKWRDEVNKCGQIRYLINTEPHLDQFAGNDRSSSIAMLHSVPCGVNETHAFTRRELG